MLQSCWWLVAFILADAAISIALYYLLRRARTEGAAAAAAAAALRKKIRDTPPINLDRMADGDLARDRAQHKKP